MFETLHQLFDNLSHRYAIKDMGLITGGVGYGEYRHFFFELERKTKGKKYVKAIVYRFENTGRYELVDYLC